MEENKSLLIRKKVNWLCYNVPIQIETAHTNETIRRIKKPLLLTFLDTDKQTHFKNENATKSTINPASTLHDIFKCVSIEGTSYENPVLYGEDFYICSANSSGPAVYMTAIISHLNNYGVGRKIPVAFTSEPSSFSKFHIIDPNPDKMNLEGTPVQTFVPTSLVHSVSDMLLAIDINDVMRTPNCIDFGAHLYTYRDTSDQICSVNHWRFITP